MSTYVVRGAEWERTSLSESGAVWLSARVLGTRGRTFESCLSDHRRYLYPFYRYQV